MRKHLVTLVVLSIVAMLTCGCERESARQMPTSDAGTPRTVDQAPADQGVHEQVAQAHEEDTSAGEQSEFSGQFVDGVRVVEVTAQRYEFMPDPIVVKMGQPVRLEVTSQDVAHGFEIEDLGIDQTLPPHETQTVEFTPEDPGEHHVHCSVYCGPGHDEMHGTLVVEE